MPLQPSSSCFRYDQFDFLIDIVPREDMKPASTKSQRDEMIGPGLITTGASGPGVRMVPDQVTYYLQQQQQQQQVAQPAAATIQPQIIQLQVSWEETFFSFNNSVKLCF